MVDRQWKAELSGRILSKAFDIRKKAEEAAIKVNSSTVRFREVAYAQVKPIRNIPFFDVFVEPVVDDDAHANLVITTLKTAPVLSGSVEKVSVEDVIELAKIFNVCGASDLSPLESLRMQAGHSLK